MGDFRGQPGVVADQRDIRRKRPAIGQFEDPLQKEGRDRLGLDLLRLGLVQGLGDDRVDDIAGDFIGLGHRVGDQLTTRQTQIGTGAQGAGHVGGRVQPQGRGQAAVTAPESGQGVLTVRDHRNPKGFKHFQGARDIKNGLGPGADDGDGGLGQFLKIAIALLLPSK